MKKIIATILAVASLAFLASCKAGLEFVELDHIKVNGISYVIAPDSQVDKKAFAEAYNKARIDDAAESDDVSRDVIVVTLSDGGVLTLYYLEDEEFAVTGSSVEKSYIIEAPELAALYRDEVYPEAKFVKLEADKYAVSSVKDPDAEIDGIPFIKAYNESKLVGKVDDEKSSETLVFICNDGEFTFNMSYYKDDKFIISGSNIRVPYIVESERLAELYEEAVK